MDPNEYLNVMRSWCQHIQRNSEDAPVSDAVLDCENSDCFAEVMESRRKRRSDAAEMLVEQFLALDKWLRAGGALPTDWQSRRA